MRCARPRHGVGYVAFARDAAAVEQACDAIERVLRLLRKLRDPFVEKRLGAFTLAPTRDGARQIARRPRSRRAIGQFLRDIVGLAEKPPRLIVTIHDAELASDR